MMNKYLTPSLLGLLLASSAANAQTTNLSTYVPTTTTVTAPLGATDYVYITQPSGTSKKLPGNTLATLVGTQTLTNKTLTSPTINAGALSGTFTGAPTLSGNIIFSGIPVMSGVITGTIASGGNLGLDVSGNVVKATVAGGSTAFSALTGSTNTTAAMLVGSGASLGTAGGGTIGATSVPASGITGTTLASSVVTSSLTTVGTIGTGVWNSTFGGSATLASAAAFGLAKVDNVTITASGGVITAVGGAATTITPGTTTIAGATAPCAIVNSATTVMACDALASGVTTFWATPTSANLRGVITDETGTGLAVFATNPTLIGATLTGTLALGTQTISGNFTVSGVPIFSAISTGTIASGGNLGLDVSGNLVKATVSGGSGVGTITGGGNTTTGVTTLAFGNGFIATPNGANTTSTVNTTFVNITKTANYSVAAGDMANGLTLSTAATLTLPAASSTIFAPGMTLSINALAPWTITNSTGLTASTNVPTVVLAGAQGTFVANSDGTHLDYFGTLGALKGTFTMATSAITSGTCATVVTVSAPGVLTTDTVTASFNGDPTGVTGFVPSASGVLTEYVYPTAGNVNIAECNFTSGSITPAAHTFNWRVAR